MQTETVTRGYLQSIVLGILGTIALGLTLTMDYYFGKSLALEDNMQIIMGAAFVGIELIVVGLAAVNGSMIRDGHGWLGAGLAIFIVFGAGLAMTATIGFGGTQRIGKSEAAVAKVNNANAQAKAENDEALRRHNEYEAWLRNTVITGATRSIRRDANERLQALVTQPVNLKGITEAAPAPDVQAEVLVRTLQTINVPAEIDTVQVGLTLAVALFLTLSQSICFGLAAYRWPVRVRVAKEIPVAKPEDSFRRAAPALRVIHNEPEESVHEKDDSADYSTANVEADPQLVANIDDDAQKLKENYDNVGRFLSEHTRPSPSARIEAGRFFNAYVVWAQRNGIEPLPKNGFGRICTALQLGRESDKGTRTKKAWYTGLALVGIGGDMEATLADAA